MNRRLPLRILALLVAVLAIGSCRIVVDEGPQTDPLPDDTSVEAEADGDVVALEVVDGPGGSTLAFVPVTINGQGPFPFALDTGASRTAISVTVADELGLPQTGRTEDVSGVVGVTEAPIVGVSDWSIGDVELGDAELIAIDLGANGSVHIAGLLGSDVLERFGRITVDYGEGALILGE